jgi:hypothetical protein
MSSELPACSLQYGYEQDSVGLCLLDFVHMLKSRATNPIINVQHSAWRFVFQSIMIGFWEWLVGGEDHDIEVQ